MPQYFINRDICIHLQVKTTAANTAAIHIKMIVNSLVLRRIIHG